MASVGGSVSPKDIVTLRKELSHYWNRDKDAIWLTLSLTYQIIENWYNNMAKAFAPEIALFLEGVSPHKRSPEEITREIEYVLKREVSPLASNSMEFLDEIVIRYEAGELRKVVDRLDIRKIRLLREALNEFYKNAMDADRSRLYPKLPGGGIYDENLIMEYILKLDAIREKVRQYVSALHNQLGCRKESLDMLHQKLEKK